MYKNKKNNNDFSHFQYTLSEKKPREKKDTEKEKQTLIFCVLFLGDMQFEERKVIFHVYTSVLRQIDC